MTNFKPYTDKIYEAAKNNDKIAFEQACLKFQEKTIGDWWRVGWDICPKNIDELLKLIDKLAQNCRTAWNDAVKCGDAPNEDVSPGEGFALCAKLIRDAIENKTTNAK